MARACSICRHIERSQIEEVLASSEPLRDIASRFGVSPPALVRHKKHLFRLESEQMEEKVLEIAEQLGFETEQPVAEANQITDQFEEEPEVLELAPLVSREEIREEVCSIFKLDTFDRVEQKILQLKTHIAELHEEEDESLDGEQLVEAGWKDMKDGLGEILREKGPKKALEITRKIVRRLESWQEGHFWDYEEEEW